MDAFIQRLFSAASVLTLSGLSHTAETAAARFPLWIAGTLLFLYGPVGALYARCKGKPAEKSEGRFYAFLLLFGGLFLWLDRESAPAVALLWMLCGGCSRSLAGGFGVGSLLNALKLVGRSVTLKTHPNAVVCLRRDGRRLESEQAADDAFRLILYMALHLVLSFFLCFGTGSFADALLLAAAAMGNSGWILLLCTGGRPACGVGAEAFLTLVMLLSRAWWVLRQLRKRK